MGTLKRYQNLIKASEDAKRVPLLDGAPADWQVEDTLGSSRNRTRQRGLIKVLKTPSKVLTSSYNRLNVRYWVDEERELVAFKFRSKQLSISSAQLMGDLLSEPINYDEANISKVTTEHVMELVHRYPKYSLELLLIYQTLLLGYDGRFNRRLATFDKHFLADELPDEIGDDPRLRGLLRQIKH